MKLLRLLGLYFIPVSLSFGHGLMVEPASRNAVCGLNEKPDSATSEACIDAFENDANGGYQFMSVLTHAEGREDATILPENVCGFDSETWNGGATPWDVATDWPTTSATAGELEIVWDIQWGSHFSDTEEFHYWITKDDFVFDSSQPLTWDDFEEEPFCAEYYDDENPTANPNIVADKSAVTFTTTCTLPARNGHHVVYGEWGRNEWTYERFHGCIDLGFGEDNLVPPTAESVEVTLDQDSSAEITLLGTDSDGTITLYSIETEPTQGTLAGSGNTYVYTPQSGFYGIDSFTYSVTDNDNQTSATATVYITINNTGNSAPVADLIYSKSGLTISVDGSGSSDAEGDALSYSWDFGDGSYAIGETSTHTYSTAGSYDVTLTVNDGALSGTEVVSVSVTDTLASSSECEYVVTNSWGTGFTAEVSIINNGSENIDDWEVSWSYSGDTVITNYWNADISGTGPYTASPASWNATIYAGQERTFGIQGSYSGDLEIPALEGDLCP
ncbi:lytic polysaccharide monooxygenase [Reinekea marinisedimentorum]|uniref:Putative carbohydrate-binding protein with CBM5 and CBM33 domain n=1 Tax=Reinekea marinisedimentorum TaxID=230495 RepID=A0A4R3I8G2_9GAMM|nr:lytic polysaccharide monooxygenase [Reinekea marinisedimentorum]TCS41611.1 putative carbohydrate-binding protein with CBM5 and CBM33 domain [Reinekea marinisedimentorum]